MKKYAIVWLKLAQISFAEQLATRFSSILFLVGKVFRFLFFLIFLLGLVSHSRGLLGYSKEQVVLFFLVFNIVDIVSQLFFRGVYFFRQKVVSGELDFYLAKPINTLFRVLVGYTDVLDLVTLAGLMIYFFWYTGNTGIGLDRLIAFIPFLILGLLLAFAIHVMVVAIGIITTEVDHTIMIYRDLTQLARLPVDIYAEPLRSILMFILPVGIMFTVPTKALLGLLSPGTIALSLILVSCFLFLSLRFWRYALSQYTSASS